MTNNSTNEQPTENTIGISETDDVVRLATNEHLGKVVDIGQQFVFKRRPDIQLSEDEDKQVALLIEAFNDRSIGTFWQDRHAVIEASLSHLDDETRAAQSALKEILADEYVTEEEACRSLSPYASEFVDAFSQLWREGKIIPTGRNEYGEILWAIASVDSTN
jgi:hypothetical protein